MCQTTTKLTNEDKHNICQKYLSGISGGQLAQQYHCNASTIYTILHKHQIPIRSDREKSLKFRCNEHYFDIIDTEHKAYWLGLLAADGYIRDSAPLGFGISLQEQDKYILEALKQDIKFTGEIKTYTTKPGSSYKMTTYCRLLISSPYLREQLIHLGIASHKTTILQFPTINQVPTSLMRHYIRGYVDGNGSITHSGTTLLDRPNLKICGTIEFLTGMQKFLGINHKINIKKDQKQRNINSGNITIGGKKELISILKLLYQNCSISLKRKRDKAIMIVESEGHNE